jgi:hypothetical protein
MTGASTFSTTKTYTRIALLKEQVRIMLRRTTNISPEWLRKFEIGIDNHWISTFLVYAFDNRNLCRAELVFEIDWDEYKLQISRGKTTVNIDQRWVDDTAIEVDEVILLFNDFVHTYSLKTEWMVRYPSWIYGDQKKLSEVRRALGLTDAEPIKWAGPKQGTSHQIPELREARVGCYLADD